MSRWCCSRGGVRGAVSRPARESHCSLTFSIGPGWVLVGRAVRGAAGDLRAFAVPGSGVCEP